jgi:plastocyanin
MSEHPNRETRESLLLPILFPVGALAIIASVLFLFSRVLLAVSSNAATVVACITATGVITVASVVASRKKLSGAALLPMVGTIFGIALIAGGVAIVAVGPPKAGGPAPITVTLTAPVGAALKGYTTTTLSFEAGIPTVLNFTNQDPTVSHNVVIFQSKDATGPVVFTGSLTTGPSTTPYDVPGLAAGTYFFHCEVHPTTMTGTITVAPAPASGSSAPSGLSISATNIAFSTKELNVTANTPTALTFTNNDPATTHNVSVYKDATYTTNVFKGDPVTGPASQTYQLPGLAAGTYYFKCDYHPTMTGTLVVAPASGGSPSASGTASPSP